MTHSAALYDLLVDPEDKGALLHVPTKSTLYNQRLRRRYPIVDGIPVLLIEEAIAVLDTAEHEQLVAAASGQR